MKTVQVEIPDTQLAIEALDKFIDKLHRAHRAAEMAKGNTTPAVTVIEEPKEPEEAQEADDSSFEAVITKDLTDKDVKKLIKDNKLSLDTRKNPSYLRKEIESLPNAGDLVNAFKEAELA